MLILQEGQDQKRQGEGKSEYFNIIVSRVSADKMHEVPSDEDIVQISQQVAHKWRLIGLQLGVDPAELDQIDYECGSDLSQCCSELFRKWAAGEVTASCPFTWRGVIETLDNDRVRESSLARDLESTYL